MAGDDAQYEFKSVRTVRGLEARTIAKLQKGGWELVTQSQESLLRTKISFRKLKRKTPWYVWGGAGAVLLVCIIAIVVGTILEGDDASERTKRPAEGAVTATPSPTPTATETEVQETTPIPFGAVTVNDDTIDVGASAITVVGDNGEMVTTYLVQYVDGVEVSRAVAREEITVAAVDEVTAIGTRLPEPASAPVAPAPAAYYENCDAVRAAGAAPIYSDDPGYSFKLDRDKDGVACET